LLSTFAILSRAEMLTQKRQHAGRDVGVGTDLRVEHLAAGAGDAKV
jgi:hypothetical protein